MSNYGLILNQYRQKLGCNQGEKYNQYDMNSMLDRLLRTNSGQQQFDREVAGQIFENTPKVENNKVVLRDYINTILRAGQILQKGISDSQQRLQFSTNMQQNEQIRQNIGQFTTDLQLISRTFKLPPPIRSKEISRQAPVKRGNRLNESHGSNGSGIFAESPSERQESTSLKLVLILLLLCIPIELVLMFVRNHFMNCFAYVFVLGIYLLNYFDRSYIRSCLFILLTAIVFDFVWMIVQSGPYWNNPPSHRSTLQAGFLKFIYVMTIILMGVKVLLAIILFRFRSNTQQTKKYVQLFNIRFDLDGRPIASPVYNLLNKNQANNIAPVPQFVPQSVPQNVPQYAPQGNIRNVQNDPRNVQQYAPQNGPQYAPQYA